MGEKSPNNGHRSSSGGGKYMPAAARRAAGSDADGGAVVLPTPSRVTNVPLQYPSLTDTNYPLWATKMKILMNPLRVWSAIEGTGEYDQAALLQTRERSPRFPILFQIMWCCRLRSAIPRVRRGR
jgi:hypothetical protein